MKMKLKRHQTAGRPLAHGDQQRKRAIFLDDARASWVSKTFGAGQLSTGVRAIIDLVRGETEPIDSTAQNQ